MTPQKVRDQIIAIDSYASGYKACLQWLVDQMAAEEKQKEIEKAEKTEN